MAGAVLGGLDHVAARGTDKERFSEERREGGKGKK